MKTKRNRPICVPVSDKQVFQSPDTFMKWAKKESYCASTQGIKNKIVCPSDLKGWMKSWGASYKRPETCRRLISKRNKLNTATTAAYNRYTSCTHTRCSTFYKELDATRNSIANTCKNHKKYYKCVVKKGVVRKIPEKEAQFKKCGTRKCRKEKSIADTATKQELHFIQRHMNPDVL